VAVKKIDLEAHFYTKEYLDALAANTDGPRLDEGDANRGRRLYYFPDVGQPFADALLHPLLDLGEGRLEVMDRYGIDVQVLSLSAPGLEQFPVEKGRALAAASNDALAEAIRRYPDRLRGYAALAPKDPEAAADELERAVTELGLIGWNTHSNFGDSYLDEPRYRPILERAEKLNVPVYLHPTVPSVPQVRTYGFALAGSPFGFGMETAMCMMRLIYSGAFDRYPNLTVILGHLGEFLPFVFKRVDWAYERPFDPTARPALAKKPSEYLASNVYVTTSGNYYEPAFLCTRAALGIDRILLGTDYPYDPTAECMEFLEGLPISNAERDKIYSGNAERIGLRI
jgi:predicted TIM-barrel fold metal-dependent hydrolase